MTSAVLFDLYCTLVDGGPQTERDEVSREMAGRLGVDPARFVPLFRETVSERMRGELGTLATTLDVLARRLGSTPTAAQVRSAEAVRMRYSRGRLRPSASTLAVLDDLRHWGLQLGLVSNCSVETVTLWPHQPLASRLHAVAFSCEVGAIKPDPAIYLTACRELGVEPARCLYVGDGESGELAAAAALGMRAVRTTCYADSDPAWTGDTIAELGEIRR